MDPRRRARIEGLMEEALERPAGERAGWLREHCGDDPELLRQVGALLAAHERPGGILDRGIPAPSVRPPERERPPRPVGPYRILSEVGRGGMSVVYRAERSDGHFRRRVALKVLRGELDADELHARLATERQILASLEHPNIARLLDGGVTEDGRPYLVMEYVEGRPLTLHCDRERLSIEERLRLFLEVARAVQHAHSHLVVHRDLKPSNILVTSEGDIRLLDFGIAKVLDLRPLELDGAGLPVTRAGTRLFTPEYASPEQLRGAPASVANDIWSLGVVLYELLAGARPFGAEGKALEALEREVRVEDPPPPSVRLRSGGPDRAAARGGTPRSVARRVEGDLDRIVAMALRKEPERRYASVEQFADDLRAHLAGRPVRARPERVGYLVGKFLRRHRVESAAAAVVFLSIVAGAGAAVWQAREARVERDRAEAAAERSEAVATYLLDMFRIADPRELPADRLTARQILDRGRDRLAELPADPVLRSRVLLAIGETYRAIGHPGSALPLLEEAAAIRRTELGPGHPATGEALRHLAELHRREGRLAEAEALALEALRASRGGTGGTGPPPDPAGLAAALDLLGFVHTGMGRTDDAMDDFRAELDLLRSSGLGDTPEAGAALVNVAAIHRRKGRFEEAEALLREAVDHRRRTLGDEHPLTAVAMARLAALLSEHLNRTAEARPLFERALEIQSRLAGPDHPDLGEPLSGLGSLLEREGDFEGAERYFREHLRILRVAFGPEHPNTLTAAEWVAGFLRRTGRPTAADSIFRETIPARRRVQGPTHPGLGGALIAWAGVLVDLGSFDEAEAAILEGLRIREEVYGPAHGLIALGMVELAELHAARGARDDEIALLERALEILEAFHPPEHPELIELRGRVAAVR